MMETTWIFRLPDLGEGLTDAEIREWHVKCGDLVSVDQPLVAVETAKAVVEIPAPRSGKIVRLYGEAGAIIETGAPLIEFAIEETATASSNIQQSDQSAKSAAATVAGKLLVDDAPWGGLVDASSAANPRVARPNATPAVRALAQKLGVDLTKLIPSGSQSNITIADVNAAAKLNSSAQDLQDPQDSNFKVDAGWEPLRGVRRSMAASMTKAHAEVALVTVFDDADLTAWEAGQDITLRLIRALIKAVQAEPSLNAWYNGQTNSRRIFKDLQLGLAMDMPEGLFVPVLRDLESKDFSAIRNEIEKIKLQVKQRSISPEDLGGHTITLSNFGVFAGKYATPIVVPPTVAILGAGKIRNKILPLSLSFDHRAVTGGEATRFLKIFIDDLQLAN